MPPKKTTAKKRTKVADAKQEEALEDLLLSEDKELPKEKSKKRVATKRRTKKTSSVATVPMIEELQEIESPAVEKRVWWKSYTESIHWAGVGIVAAASLAGIVLGFLVAHPACSGFMEKFLFPWRLPLVTSVIKNTAEVQVATTFIVSTDESETTAVTARPVETDLGFSQDFDSTGFGRAADARSSGVVTITNTSSRGFTFVATTRLLSQEGVLFRLKSQVVIPPNSSVTAEVAADVIGPSGDIGQSTFIFPGLSGATQEQITATSSTSMTGGTGTVKVVTEEDINRAKLFLKAQADKDAFDNFRAMVGGGERLLRDLIVLQKQEYVLPEVGDVSESFTAKLDAHARALIFSEADVEQKVIAKYLETYPDADKESLTVRNMIYVVQAYDIAKDRAEVRVEAEVIP